MYAIWPSLLINSVFGVVVIFVLFFIPLIILIYCNGRILWILTRRIDLDSSKSDAPSLNNIPATRDTFQLARTNTLKTFLLVGLCFIICWSNNQIYFLMYNLGYEINWNGTYYLFTVLMVFINCTVNPFIYLIKYRDYQQALKKLLGCRRKTEKNSFGITSSNASILPSLSGGI